MALFIELSSCGAAALCRVNGKNIGKNSQLFKDLKDCVRGGCDNYDSCVYVIKTYCPIFRIVKKCADGQYRNLVANHPDKIALCKTIYFESETDFQASESICEVYLVWSAADALQNDSA